MESVKQAAPQDTLLQVLVGFWASRCVYVAAKLGIADLLDSPKTAEQLAHDTGMHPRAMYRLMRALACGGIFRERNDGRFEQTDASRFLRSDIPNSLRYTMLSELGPTHYGPWGELLHSVQTGQPAFDHVFGEPIFSWFQKHPDRSKIFNQSMSELTAMVEPAVLEAYDFSNCGTLVDVGGGRGSLIAAVLRKHKSLRGVVYDAPHVVEAAKTHLAEMGVADRATTAAGDFFHSVPAGGDTYMMKHIIHDWDDDLCRKILRNCHKVLKPGGKVLIIDQVLPGRNEFSPGKFSDLLMMVMPGGAERTEKEFRALLESSGFKCARIIPTNSIVDVVEGVRE